MNALPTLSPIGQQRRQAAGDAQMVSTISYMHKHMHSGQQVDRQHGEHEEGSKANGKTHGFGDIKELLIDSEASPGMVRSAGVGMVKGGAGVGVPNKHGKSCWGAIGDRKPNQTQSISSGREMDRESYALGTNGNLIIFWLTADGKPTGAYNRVTPVSISLSFH